MRKWLAMLFAMTLMVCGAAQGEAWAKKMLTEEEMGAMAQADFPGWQIWRNSWYGSGMWEDEMAIHSEIELLRVTEDQLLIRHLDVVKNGLKQGDPIPWEVTDYAPVPLTQEAAERLAGMSPDAVMERYNGPEVNADGLDGCAEFLLGEGETMAELYVYPDFLVAVVQDAEGREGLRIGHWNGAEYAKVTASPMQAQDIYIVSVHSYNDYLELHADGVNIVLRCGADGEWRLGHAVTWDAEFYETGYSIGEDRLYAYDDIGGDPQNNDWIFYGRPTFPTQLTELDFGEILSRQEAVSQLDTAGLACVKREGAGMYDAPEGSVLASCYARLVGTVLAEQDGWVQLQIGSAEQGMTAWFRAEDMAFGAEVNEVVCSFPSYRQDAWWWDMEDMSAILPEHGAELDPWSVELWLIAKLPDGDWLAQVNGDLVCVVSQEVIGEVGPTWHAWEEEWW